MELILINDSKLKVMLTPADMASYAITCETIDYENTETRRAFWNILDEAKQKTGFDAASDRVFIQVYPSKNGGCEMYVTKLIYNENNEPQKSLCPKIDTYDKFDDQITCKINVKYTTLPEIYQFDNVEDLLAVCRQLSIHGYIEQSSAYADMNGKFYYLVLSNLSVQKYDKINCYSFLSEYGDYISINMFESYLSEYCTYICEGNAVGTLSKL